MEFIKILKVRNLSKAIFLALNLPNNITIIFKNQEIMIKTLHKLSRFILEMAATVIVLAIGLVWVLSTNF